MNKTNKHQKVNQKLSVKKESDKWNKNK